MQQKNASWPLLESNETENRTKGIKWVACKNIEAAKKDFALLPDLLPLKLYIAVLRGILFILVVLFDEWKWNMSYFPADSECSLSRWWGYAEVGTDDVNGPLN